MTTTIVVQAKVVSYHVRQLNIVFIFVIIEIFKSLLGNASLFTLGFIRFLSEFGHFHLMKLFNPLMNGDQLL